MKKTALAILLILILVASLGAQERRRYGASAGMVLNEYADDFGIGIQLSSPFIFDVLAFRLTGTMQFSRVADWVPWWTAQAGLTGSGKIVAGFARFYGEGGAVLAFPDSSMSSADYGWGGYGVFGFEFFTGVESPVSYYLEVGATGSGLRADLAGGSLILNGLRIQVGFRGYPFKGNPES